MDLLDVLRDLGVPFRTEGHEHCRAGWVQLDCPWCTPGAHHWRLGISLSWLSCNCWACGHKSTIQAIALSCQRSYKEVEGLLGTVERPLTPAEIKPRGRLVLPAGLGPLLPAHKRYLSGRGFDPEELERLWNLKGLGQTPALPWRLWIPLVYQGRVVSWTTRKISDKAGLRRYLTAAPGEEEISHKHLLGGEDYCRHAVVVCEGPLDAMAIGPGAVWTGGLAYTRQQLNRIAKYPVRVVCFDSEPEAQKRARQLCQDLHLYPGSTYRVELESDNDPASADRAEVAELRQRFLLTENK